jgi:hypothetical protein
LKGITESITLGKLGKMGTGSFELFYSEIEEPTTELANSDSECTDTYFEDLVYEESYFDEL